jgi:hypothetical protein
MLLAQQARPACLFENCRKEEFLEDLAVEEARAIVGKDGHVQVGSFIFSPTNRR